MFGRAGAAHTAAMHILIAAGAMVFLLNVCLVGVATTLLASSLSF
jgi:hypothetical protein